MNRLSSLIAVPLLASVAIAEVRVLTSNTCSGTLAPTTEVMVPFVDGRVARQCLMGRDPCHGLLASSRDARAELAVA